MYFKENLQYLKERNFWISYHFKENQFSNANVEDCTIEFFSKEPTIKFKGIYLYSKINPLKTARVRVGKTLTSKTFDINKVYILTGFGLGYEIELLLKMLPSNVQLIIFTEESIFRCALQSRNLKDILKDKRIINIFSLNSIDIEIAYRQLFKGFFEKLYDVISFNIPCESKKAEKVILNMLKHAAAYKNTLTKLSRSYFENFVTNFPRYIVSVGIKEIFNKTDIPVVVISGGPSLQNDLDSLREIQKYALLIAISASFKPLLSAGVIPDLVLYVDPSEKQYISYFKDVHIPESVKVVLPVIVNKHIFGAVKDSSLLVFDIDAFGKVLGLFSHYWKGKGYIANGQTVSHYAFRAALKISSGPVILVGQDLAYPIKGYTHIPGSGNEKKIEISEKDRKNYIWVRGNYKPLVPSTYAFEIFKNTFSSIVQEYKQRIFINATSGGAYIDGFQVARLQTDRVQNLIRNRKNLIEKRKILKEFKKLDELRERYKNHEISKIPGLLQDLEDKLVTLHEFRQFINLKKSLSVNDKIGLLIKLDHSKRFREFFYAILELNGDLFTFHNILGKLLERQLTFKDSLEKLQIIFDKIPHKLEEFIKSLERLRDNLKSVGGLL